MRYDVILWLRRQCHPCTHITHHAGIFALLDLPEESVVGKYEGHRVDAAGNIVRRCILTDILFNSM